MKDVCVQTQDSARSVESLSRENDVLKKKLLEQRVGVATIQGNGELTKFYTGLPTWAVFLHVFCFLSPYVTSSTSMCLEDELLLVLVRLWLGLFIQDATNRFNVSPSHVSRTSQKWLDVHVCPIDLEVLACLA